LTETIEKFITYIIQFGEQTVMRQDIFSVLRHNSVTEVRQFLSGRPELCIPDLLDQKQSTVLHLACNQDNTDLVEHLLTAYDRQAAADR